MCTRSADRGFVNFDEYVADARRWCFNLPEFQSFSRRSLHKRIHFLWNHRKQPSFYEQLRPGTVVSLFFCVRLYCNFFFRGFQCFGDNIKLKHCLPGLAPAGFRPAGALSFFTCRFSPQARPARRSPPRRRSNIPASYNPRAASQFRPRSACLSGCSPP